MRETSLLTFPPKWVQGWREGEEVQKIEICWRCYQGIHCHDCKETYVARWYTQYEGKTLPPWTYDPHRYCY